MEETMGREPVPYTVYESAQARADRRFRLMWILSLVLIILLVGTNAGWVYYEQQFEDTVITQDNANGYNNYIGNDGDITNGKADN